MTYRGAGGRTSLLYPVHPPFFEPLSPPNPPTLTWVRAICESCIDVSFKQLFAIEAHRGGKTGQHAPQYFCWFPGRDAFSYCAHSALSPPGPVYSKKSIFQKISSVIVIVGCFGGIFGGQKIDFFKKYLEN